ncbi:MAG: hypothetical protein AAF802_33350, partial [Planctomycetota bacterium]
MFSRYPRAFHALLDTAVSKLAYGLLICLTPCFATAADLDSVYADANAEAVKPSNPVLHGLQIQSLVDDEQHYLTLSGPEFFSAPAKSSANNTVSYLTWYDVRKPKWSLDREVKVASERSDKLRTLTLGAPKFFLMPAQVLANGPPAVVPEQLNHFLVYAASDPSSDVQSFLAVPAEEWHHDEHFPIKSRDAWLMITPTKSGAVSESDRSVLDQFGLNKLSGDGVRYQVQRVRP